MTVAAASTYRFNKVETERLSMLKGEDSWYRIGDESGGPGYHCHVLGNCTGGATTFHASREDAQVLFRLEPKRKLMCLTYFVGDGADGERLATVELFVSRGMKVLAPSGAELFRIVDPQSKLDKLMQDILDGCCSEYAIVADGRIVGTFERRVREQSAEEARGARKLLRRLLGGLLRDWCVEVTGPVPALSDTRPLLAALILLQEQTIRLDQSISS
ncbi:MAG: hypothetical protein GY716_22675 [bacterium]|nr:hypothetical protein [bacterium]